MIDVKEYMRDYRLKHKKKEKEYQKKYYLEHPNLLVKSRKRLLEKRDEINKKRRDSYNPEVRKEYYNLNQEKIKEYVRKWYRKTGWKHRILHQEEINERVRKWKKSHPERVKEWARIYSHNRRSLVGNLTLQTIQEVYDKNIIANGGVLKCIYCNRELTKKEATLEHKYPVSRGGTNEKENLAIACLHCNDSKGSKTEEDFRNYLIKKKNLWAFKKGK